jgi:hypothetical protein
MIKKPRLKPEDLAKPLRDRLDPVLAEPAPDEWLEPLVRQLYGEPEQGQEEPECKPEQASSRPECRGRTSD